MSPNLYPSFYTQIDSFIENLALEAVDEGSLKYVSEINKYSYDLLTLEYQDIQILLDELNFLNGRFFARILGGEHSSLPKYKELANFLELKDYIEESFLQIEKCGGLTFYVVSEKNRTIFFVVTYRKDLGIYFLKEKENLDLIAKLRTKKPEIFVYEKSQERMV